jgi:LysR family glycine cleavage system transcriptional activator
MAERLPPLNALKAFEVAARTGSIVAAARELNRTHGAISRQIKHLEDVLGMHLFVRTSKGLQLTNEGRTFSLVLQAAFDSIGKAFSSLKPETARPERQAVHLTTLSSFATRWLVPRLSKFATRHPSIDLRITATDQLSEFNRGSADLAIRYGRGRWPISYVERLLPATLIPVCSPTVAASGRGLRSPSDLQFVTLIHDLGDPAWERWFEAAKVKQVNLRAGLVLDDFNVMLQAALEDFGVALLPLPLVEAELRAGRLVRPFTRVLNVEFGYYLVCPKTNLDNPAVSSLARWLLSEARSQDRRH